MGSDFTESKYDNYSQGLIDGMEGAIVLLRSGHIENLPALYAMYKQALEATGHEFDPKSMTNIVNDIAAAGRKV